MSGDALWLLNHSSLIPPQTRLSRSFAGSSSLMKDCSNPFDVFNSESYSNNDSCSHCRPCVLSQTIVTSLIMVIKKILKPREGLPSYPATTCLNVWRHEYCPLVAASSTILLCCGFRLNHQEQDSSVKHDVSPCFHGNKTIKNYPEFPVIIAEQRLVDAPGRCSNGPWSSGGARLPASAFTIKTAVLSP